jgi:hypothetical protein
MPALARSDITARGAATRSFPQGSNGCETSSTPSLTPLLQRRPVPESTLYGYPLTWSIESYRGRLRRESFTARRDEDQALSNAVGAR